jgi:hypothetical protein
VCILIIVGLDEFPREKGAAKQASPSCFASFA